MRDVFYSQTVNTTVAVSSSVPAIISSLTFTNKANAQYYTGGTWELRSNRNQDMRSTLMYLETAATATVAVANCGVGAAGSPLNIQLGYGFRRITTPASAGTQKIQLYAGVSSVDTMGDVRNIRIWAIKATAADKYDEHVSPIHAPAGIRRVATSIAVSPGSAADYLIMAAGGIQTQSIKMRGGYITHQTTTRGIEPQEVRFGASQSESSYALMDVLRFQPGTNNVTHTILACANTSMQQQWGSLAVIPLATFDSYFMAASDVTAVTSSATFVTGLSTVAALHANCTYGIMALARHGSKDVTQHRICDFILDGATANSSIFLNTETAAVPATYTPLFVMQIVTASGGSHEMYWRQRIQTDAGCELWNQRIVVVQFTTVAVAAGVVGYYYFDRWHRI